jgi:hypothetical protein
MNIQTKCCLAALLFLASCSADISDRLEGKWQMQEIAADGKTEKVDTIFYNFQTSLFMYQIYRPSGDTYASCYGFKMMETKNRVLLELTDYGVTAKKFLPQTDWEETSRRFTVEEVTRQRLVLEADGKRYTFRRF